MMSRVYKSVPCNRRAAGSTFDVGETFPVMRHDSCKIDQASTCLLECGHLSLSTPNLLIDDDISFELMAVLLYQTSSGVLSIDMK